MTKLMTNQKMGYKSFISVSYSILPFEERHFLKRFLNLKDLQFYFLKPYIPSNRISLKWLQWDSNPQPLSLYTNNEHLVKLASVVKWLSFGLLTVVGSNPVEAT